MNCWNKNIVQLSFHCKRYSSWSSQYTKWQSLYIEKILGRHFESTQNEIKGSFSTRYFKNYRIKTLLKLLSCWKLLLFPYFPKVNLILILLLAIKRYAVDIFSIFNWRGIWIILNYILNFLLGIPELTIWQNHSLPSPGQSL